VGPDEGVKPQLSQALTRDARPDSNSRPAMQISNPLPSRYACWGLNTPSQVSQKLLIEHQIRSTKRQQPLPFYSSSL